MADTIAALATGNVVSAIGIIRISGDEAIEIAGGIFKAANGKDMKDEMSSKLVYGSILDENGAVLDHCLCTISRAPYSYTGENTAEFQCHGSPVVLREVLDLLFRKGARQARAGEFTQRAFLNGKMDLCQAEAVIDLIEAETSFAAKNAAGQLGGKISQKIENIYRKLTEISSHYYAVIDYPDEDIDEFQMGDYARVLQDCKADLQALHNSFKRGKILREGLSTAIIGRPNVGKSSLLNALLGYERAIVTDIEGTTRDTIEEKVSVAGLVLRLIDTAGLRESDSEIERLGIERTRHTAETAELVIAVFDGSVELSAGDLETFSLARDARRAIAVVSKSDLERKIDMEVINGAFAEVCEICALEHKGLEDLETSILRMFPMPKNEVGEILTNLRQAEAVREAIEAISAAQKAMKLGISPDAVLTETEAAMASLGLLTGRNIRDDVTEDIFSRFCVGK